MISTLQMKLLITSIICALITPWQTADAGDQGQLLATSGLLSPGGSAGGGITGWAVLSGYGGSRSWGGAVQGSIVALDDYNLTNAAISISVNDRFEFFVGKNRRCIGIDSPGDVALR